MFCFYLSNDRQIYEVMRDIDEYVRRVDMRKSDVVFAFQTRNLVRIDLKGADIRLFWLPVLGVAMVDLLREFSSLKVVSLLLFFAGEVGLSSVALLSSRLGPLTSALSTFLGTRTC